VKSIGQRWVEFARRAIDAGASQLQHDEMRMAFYAGCAVMVDVQNEIASIPGYAVCVLVLESVYEEVRKFNDDLREAEAQRIYFHRGEK
jgi:hypothetical protein